MAGTIPMAQYNPGIFTTNSQGFGQAAAQNVNDDGSLTTNSQANPVSRDGKHQIVFYLTGAGVFDGGGGAPPPDGLQPTNASLHAREAVDVKCQFRRPGSGQFGRV